MGRPKKNVQETPEEAKQLEWTQLSQRWAEDDAKEKKEKIDALNREDARKEAERMAQEQVELQIRQEQEQTARDKYLKKPLTEQEMAHYEQILVMCNSAHTPSEMTMRKLIDYRIKLKNNGDKNPR